MKGRSSVLVAIAYDVLRHESATASLADLSEAVKIRAAQSRVPYRSDAVAAAIASVVQRRPPRRRQDPS